MRPFDLLQVLYLLTFDSWAINYLMIKAMLIVKTKFRKGPTLSHGDAQLSINIGVGVEPKPMALPFLVSQIIITMSLSFALEIYTMFLQTIFAMFEV